MSKCKKCGPIDLGCLFKSSTDCVIYEGPAIPNLGIQDGDNLTQILQKISTAISTPTTTTTTSSTTTSTTTSGGGTTTTTTTTTAQVFDTQLTYESNSYDFEEGVGGQALTTSPILKLEFNKILNPVGLYNTMNILFQGTPALQVNYRLEYLGQPFRFTHTNGAQRNGVFGNDINFS